MRAHFAVPQADADIAGPQQFSFKSERALPAKMRSFSVFEISRLFTALMVSRMSMRPCSASKGASVANTQWPVVKNSCPQRVAEAEPLMRRTLAIFEWYLPEKDLGSEAATKSVKFSDFVDELVTGAKGRAR